MLQRAKRATGTHFYFPNMDDPPLRRLVIVAPRHPRCAIWPRPEGIYPTSRGRWSAHSAALRSHAAEPSPAIQFFFDRFCVFVSHERCLLVETLIKWLCDSGRNKGNSHAQLTIRFRIRRKGKQFTGIEMGIGTFLDLQWWRGSVSGGSETPHGDALDIRSGRVIVVLVLICTNLTLQHERPTIGTDRNL